MSRFDINKARNQEVKKSMRTFIKRQLNREQGITQLADGRYIVRFKRPNNRVITVGAKDTLAEAEVLLKEYIDGKELPQWNN